MWNPIKKYRLRKDWRLVKTIDTPVNWCDSNGKSTGKIDKVYYYLSENGLGERKCEHKGTGEAGGEMAFAFNIRKTREIYLDVILPWLKDRYDPKIPSYKSIKAKEMKDALAGKIT